MALGFGFDGGVWGAGTTPGVTEVMDPVSVSSLAFLAADTAFPEDMSNSLALLRLLLVLLLLLFW